MARDKFESRRTRMLWVVMMTVCALGSGCRPPGSGGDQAAETANAQGSALAFFDRYVDRTGRVVRHDQGGDTVSEGQAYALLLAVALRDRARFELVWTWTRDNLQRPDKLFSWRWDSGVSDDQSAADADLDIARALVLAGWQFDDRSLVHDGVVVGRSILDHETVVLHGWRLLLPGRWAANRPPPVSVNPSYVSPVATQVLWRATKDGRWRELERGSRAIVRKLSPHRMPPDWAVVEADGGVRPDPSKPSSGWDAIRVPLRHAESCDAADRRLAAGLANHLDRGPERGAVGWMAEAAGHAAAGDRKKAEKAMDHAAEERRRHSTYYGDAWDALARFMLLDNRLGGCPRPLTS
jgi:endoglucanase